MSGIIIGLALVLGVIILIHEWGHFIMARLFKVRVDVFSIGFGPRLFGWKRGDTDYRISALPLGGYVRMAGQDPTEIDSADRDWLRMKSGSSEKETDTSDVTRKVAEFRGVDQPLRPGTGAPDELMSKPRWQRALISFAGPAVNLIMPILLLGGFYAVKGFPYQAYLNKPIVLSELPSDGPLAKNGAKDGDQIVAVNGIQTANWNQAERVLSEIAQGQNFTLTIAMKDGAKHNIAIDGAQLKPGSNLLGYPPAPAIVGQLTSGMPAKAAGLKEGDLIENVNGIAVHNWYQCVDLIKKSGGAKLKLVVQRSGSLVNLEIPTFQD